MFLNGCRHLLDPECHEISLDKCTAGPGWRENRRVSEQKEQFAILKRQGEEDTGTVGIE